MLDIRLGEVADTELGAALLAVAPKVGAFAISFLIVVSAWGTHFRMFRLVRGFDPALIRINLAFLFLVCLMPFTTSVMAEHGDSPWSLIPHGANLGLIFATHALQWRHLRRAGLLDDIVDDRLYAGNAWRLWSLAAMFLVPLPVGFFRPQIIPFLWLVAGGLLMLANIVRRRREGREHPEVSGADGTMNP